MTAKQVVVVLGSQWGDEGKGKIVDTLAADFGLCVRFNGGSNAGHTIVVDGVKHGMVCALCFEIPVVNVQCLCFDQECALCFVLLLLVLALF